jgi:hypothetical protein
MKWPMTVRTIRRLYFERRFTQWEMLCAFEYRRLFWREAAGAVALVVIFYCLAALAIEAGP